MAMNIFSGRVGGGAGGAGYGAPHRGQGPFGLVPGAIDVPENIYSQESRTIPGFGNLAGGASGIIGSEQSGELSPQTLNALRTASAQYGVGSGMPGSGLAMNNLLGNIAGFTEQRQRQGVQDYMSLLNTVAPTLTQPGLAYEVAARNAAYAAAPDPQAAAERELAEYMLKFNLGRRFGGGGFGGGPGGGYGNINLAGPSHLTGDWGAPPTNMAYSEPPQSPWYQGGEVGPHLGLNPGDVANTSGAGRASLVPYIDASRYAPGTTFNPAPYLNRYQDPGQYSGGDAAYYPNTGRGSFYAGENPNATGYDPALYEAFGGDDFYNP